MEQNKQHGLELRGGVLELGFKILYNKKNTKKLKIKIKKQFQKSIFEL